MGRAGTGVRAVARDLIDTSLTKYYVKHHHQDKTNGETDGAKVAVLTTGGLGYEFLDHHIEHGSCCKGQHVG